MFSSRTDMWATDQKFFEKINNQYHFTHDVCATDNNAKCNIYFTEEQNGLIQEWGDISWCNPPYGITINKWIEKAYKESEKGKIIVMLLPARTCTKWFHKWIYRIPGVKIDFIKGRLTFGDDAYWEGVWETEFINGKENKLFGKIGRKNTAPFPSMLVEFNIKQIII